MQFIAKIALAIVLKLLIIDFLYVIITITNSVYSFNIIQGWLILVCNLLYYYFYFSLIILLINAIGVLFLNNEIIPILSLKEFLLNLLNRIYLVLYQSFEKHIVWPKWILQSIFLILISIGVVLITDFKVTSFLWIGIQLFIFFLSIKKQFKSAILNVVLIIISAISWVLLSASYHPNILGVISGLVSIKGLLLYYNEYYITWGVGLGWIALLFILLFVFIAIKMQYITSNIATNSKKTILFSLIISICVFFIKHTQQQSFYSVIASADKYPAKLKPLQKNKWLNELVVNSDNHTSLIVNFKKKLIDNIQERIDYYFYEHAISNYLREIEQHLHINEHDEFVVFPYHSIYKLEKNGKNLPRPKRNLEITVAKNEWENFQLMIIPNVNSNIIEIETSLLFPEKIGFEKFEFYQNEFVQLLKPQYSTAAHTGHVSDPLIPLTIIQNNHHKITGKNSIPLKIKSGECSSIWCSIKTNELTQAGNHILTFQIKCKIMPINKWIEKIVQIKIQVLDYSLPQTMTIKTAFSTSPNLVRHMNFYSNYTLNDSLYKAYAYQSLKYLLNPCDLYSTSAMDNSIKVWSDYVEKGANAICLGSIKQIRSSDIMQHKAYKYFLKRKIDSLKLLQLHKYAYFYAFDEVKESGYPELKRREETVHEIERNIPVSFTIAKPTQASIALGDIMIVNTEYYNKDYHKQKTTWWYVCNGPTQKGFANFFTDYDAIAPRILFWQANKYNIEGLLYFCTVLWTNNTYCPNTIIPLQQIEMEHNPNEKALKEGKRWPAIPWVSYSGHDYNGDGQLFYPGKTQYELWPSIRLMNIRDGIEDYEYACQIKQLNDNFLPVDLKAKKEHWIKAFNTFINDYKSYDNNPERLIKLKKEAGLILEEWNKYSFKKVN
jgi:hypothetical protein